MGDEIWKSLESMGFLGYEVSNYGKIRSYRRYPEGRLIKLSRNKSGYLDFSARALDGTFKKVNVHIAVARMFLGHTETGRYVVVNHINENKLDNRVENLEIVTNRYNSIYSIDKSKTSSKYIGVTLDNRSNRWIVSISFKAKRIHLKSLPIEFEYEGGQTYIEAKKIINKYPNMNVDEMIVLLKALGLKD